jgi:apolipoprotein N-acyltransferase
MGLQFGLISLLATKKILISRFCFLALPASWTILEWSRIYWCSGFYFDLVGLSLASNLTTLQTASLFGVLGMSFWVMLTNTLFVRAYLISKKGPLILAFLIALLPYIYGGLQLKYHEYKQQAYDLQNPPITALIVHSKKVPEEFKPQPRPRLTPHRRAYLAWEELINAISPFYGQKHDLILMPEGVVPYGSSSLLFNKYAVNSLFLNAFKTSFDSLDDDLASSENVASEIAKLYNCPLIIGLEGIERNVDKTLFYNSAFFFPPTGPIQRYDKQVLVPMGEYIPCTFAKKWAAKYGIFDSFTPGTEAKTFQNGKMQIGASICYEETVGSLMRQNHEKGANLLVNLTDDYWFPYSTLAIQHFEHARPRTVENGVPLIRSCNFGISGVVDSLGRTVEIREGSDEPSAFSVSFSTYHYQTIYGKFGDLPILFLSLGIILTSGYFIRRK